jgi:hypothetical protein
LIRMLWPELNEAQNQPPALIYTWTLRWNTLFIIYNR